MESSVMAAADYDYIYQATDSAREFWEKINEVGLKETFSWRDGRYNDGRSKTGN